MGYIYSMKNETAVTKERYRRVPVVRPGQKPWGYSEAVASSTPVAFKLNVPQMLPLKKVTPVKRSKASISVYETMDLIESRNTGGALIGGAFVFLPPAVILPGLYYLSWGFPIVGAICGVIAITCAVFGFTIVRDALKTEAGIE